MSIFISHVHEESALAALLKSWIEDTFLGQQPVFVSSDSDDLPAGSRWLEEIDSALKESRVLLLLASRSSIARPWINFEAGCSWIKRVPIIPICHSGLTISQLSPPLSMFQGLDAGTDDFPVELVRAIARHLGVERLPRIDSLSMKAELEGVLSSISTGSSGEAQPALASASTLEEEEARILVLLTEAGGNRLTSDEVARHAEIHPERAKYRLERLEKQGYIHGAHFYTGQPSQYRLAELGRKFLIDNGHI